MQRISAIFDLIIWSHRDLGDDFLRPPLGALCVDALNHTLCTLLKWSSATVQIYFSRTTAKEFRIEKHSPRH